MDPLQLAGMVGDFISDLLALEDEVELSSILRPDNVMVVHQRIQLKENLPASAYVPVAGFAAPEQYVAANCERAPVYFIGALLYTLLYGKPPADVRARLSGKEAVEMSTTPLSGVITHCLELHPQDRYANLGQVLWELNEILEDADITKPKETTPQLKTEKEPINVVFENKEVETIDKINSEKPEEKPEEKPPINSNDKKIKTSKIWQKKNGKTWLKNKKNISLVCLAILACMILGYTLWQGQRAEAALESGEYNEVVSSINQTPWLRATRNDAYHYAKAQQLWEEGLFEEAQEIFVELSDYADSAVLVQEIQYDKGLALANNLQLEEAKLVFDSLGAFSDSSAQSANIVAYQQASAQEDAGSKYMAFLELGDYLNSEQLAKEASAQVYEQAKISYTTSNFEQASQQFGLVMAEQDAVVYKQLCDLWVVASDEAAENREALMAIMAYGDVANIEPVVMSDKFFMIFLEGNWVSSNGGGEMNFETDSFRAPLLNVAGEDWTFDAQTIHNANGVEAVFEYISPNEISMTISDTGENYVYQRQV